MREILPPSVSLQTLNVGGVLSLNPRLVLFVALECIAFLGHRHQVSPSVVVISKADEIFLSIVALGVRRPPYIGVDFLTNLCGLGSLLFQWNGLMCGFCLCTCCAKPGLASHIHVKSHNNPILDKFSCSLWGYVSHAMV